MNIDQLRQLAPELIKIAQRYGIVKIHVFGSVARGEATAKSDVDFLVDLREGASLFGVAGFNYDTEKLLGVQVDVVPSTLLAQMDDQEFALNIQREAVPL
jgi:uncharacterized protein